MILTATPRPRGHKASPGRRLLSDLLPLLLLVLALGAWGCGESTEGDGTEVAENSGGEDSAEETQAADGAGQEDDAKEEEKKPKKARRERSTSVNAAKTIRGDLIVPIVAEGAVRARNSAEMRFEIGGRIDRIFVTEGDRVKRGQLLARIDGREWAVAMEEARTRYLEALAKLAVEEEDLGKASQGKSLQEQLDELSALERRGVITREERMEREVDLGVAAVKGGEYRREILEVRTGLATSRADEERARLNLERTEIRAPFGGVITNLDLSRGEMVTANQVLCSLVDDIELEAEVGVLESDLKGLVVGRPALLDIPALGQTLRASVDVVSPQIDPDSRTCSVLFRLRSEDGLVKPGMFVRAAIAGEIFEDRLQVPREAILSRDGRPLLFKVDDDRAKWLYVETGLRNDQMVEIVKVLQGGKLAPDDLVVVSDHLTLSHEAKIKVKNVVDSLVAWSADGDAAETN